MKCLYVGDNICGIPNVLKRAALDAGHDARVMSFDPDPQGHVSDYDYREPSRIKKFMLLFPVSGFYDTFIFTGDSIFWGADILFWKLLGKKVAVHYHGSEVRGKGPRFFHRFADARFVSTPDLLEYVPGATWIPNPIFVGDYKQHYTMGLVVAHAPTNRILKGTQTILDAFQKAKERHPLANLDLVEGLPYTEALEHYRKATIVVDQVKIGWYGMVALECMAMKVPVMCYIRKDLMGFIFETGMNPVFFTLPSCLEEDLDLALDPTFKEILDERSEEGYEYVNEIHNPKRCVDLIVKSLEGS